MKKKKKKKWRGSAIRRDLGGDKSEIQVLWTRIFWNYKLFLSEFLKTKTSSFYCHSPISISSPGSYCYQLLLLAGIIFYLEGGGLLACLIFLNNGI